MDSAEWLTYELGGRYNGRNGIARCPAHDDRHPSLSIAERDGKLLLHCFAGCDYHDIVEALRAMGYWPVPFGESEGVAEWTADDRRRLAIQKWREAQPCAGTIAEDYLDSRRIGCYVTSPALRFHPELWHTPTDRCWPALIAAVFSLETLRMCGILRTYLNYGGNKLSFEPNRMSLGPVTGGVVPLDDPDVPTEIAIGEGIETAASVGLLCGLPA